MPVRKLVRAAPHPDAARLRELLEEEWRRGDSANAQPVILEDRPRSGQPLHVYVIWDEWADLRQVERSEIIMQAMEAVRGPDAAADVTVAMGLTSAEAERMGIQYR